MGNGIFESLGAARRRDLPRSSLDERLRFSSFGTTASEIILLPVADR